MNDIVPLGKCKHISVQQDNTMYHAKLSMFLTSFTTLSIFRRVIRRLEINHVYPVGYFPFEGKR